MRLVVGGEEHRVVVDETEVDVADGLEVVLSSNRTGTRGAQDIWVSTRGNVADAWGAPVNIGPEVNTGAAESRPSLSRTGDQLLFGRTPGPEGSGDIYVSTR